MTKHNTLYNPNTEGKQNFEKRVRVISIDPGVQNYCIRVEEKPFEENGHNLDNGEIKTLLYDKLKLKKAQS